MKLNEHKHRETRITFERGNQKDIAAQVICCLIPSNSFCYTHIYIHKENEGSLKKKDKKMSEINEVVLATMECCDICITGVSHFPIGLHSCGPIIPSPD